MKGTDENVFIRVGVVMSTSGVDVCTDPDIVGDSALVQGDKSKTLA